MMMDCADIATLLYAVPPHILNAVHLDTDPIGNSTYDGSFNQVWGGEEIAPPGTHPMMLAAYSQNDRGSILPLDRTALKHWVEVEAVHVGGLRGPPGAQTSRGPSEPGTPPPEFDFEEDNTTPHSGNTPGGSFTMQGACVRRWGWDSVVWGVRVGGMRAIACHGLWVIGLWVNMCCVYMHTLQQKSGAYIACIHVLHIMHTPPPSTSTSTTTSTLPLPLHRQ